MSPHVQRRPSTRGPRKGDHLKYNASYEIIGADPREISIDRRWQKSGVRVDANAVSSDGRDYAEKEFPQIVVLRRRPAGFEGKDGRPGIGSGINRNPSLRPKENTVLELWVRDEEAFVALLRWYSGGTAANTSAASPHAAAAVAANEGSAPENPRPTSPEPNQLKKKSMSLDELLARLGANAETGHAGELIALAVERERVRMAGCLEPSAAVRHVAPVDVNAGFDIESAWNGERRCIEVKSSTSDGGDFFLSENERVVLAALGADAWLYRVRVDAERSGKVVELINDPMKELPGDAFEPVVWRVRRNRST